MPETLKVFRLNRCFSSNYALFVIEGDVVTFRQFTFYTGELVREERMGLQAGRDLYRQMIASRVKTHHYDKKSFREWVPVVGHF